MRTKFNRKTKAKNELEEIIQRFGDAMRSANKEYVASATQWPILTRNMEDALEDYYLWCRKHAEKESLGL